MADAKPRSRHLKRGDRLRFRSEPADTIKARKETDDGWWMTSGGGLADYAFDSQDDWQLAESPEGNPVE